MISVVSMKRLSTLSTQRLLQCAESEEHALCAVP